MRALLVVNPTATATTPRARDILARALGSDIKVDVALTAGRGHAVELGRRAVADGLDLVVALGGDGTVNEVVNGLLADGPGPEVPALAVVPGGSANVFARALGLSESAVEATSEILDALRAGRERTIGLGQADERWFTFCTGFGLDAEVIRLVERQRLAGRRATTGLYVTSAVRHFFGSTDRRRPTVLIERPGQAPIGPVFLTIATNTSPWTYLGQRAVQPTPRSSFELGLDVLALRRLGALGTVSTVLQTLSARPRLQGRRHVQLHDQAAVTLTSTRPMAFQVDGDYVGDRARVNLTSVPVALRVVV